MKKLLSILVVLLLVAGMLSACGGSAAPSSGGASSDAASEEETVELSDATVVIAESSEWWGNDVNQLDGATGAQSLVADVLVTMDEEGNLGPCMAEAVEVSDDGLTITLTMPEDLKFASGEPVLPEDVVASIEYYKDASPMGYMMDAIESMDIDGQKVILHLSQYSSDLSVTLAGQMYNIQDKDVLESTSREELLWGAKPYGMYYLDEYVEGSHVVLKRNDYYKTYNPYVENKGPGYYAEITVRFITEEFSRATAFNTGDIDAVLSISQDGLAQITREDAKPETMLTVPIIHYLGINLNSEPFKDIKVRQALAYAIDRDRINDDCGGVAVPSYSLASEGVINRNKEFAEWYKNEYGTNPEKAAQLLEEAGWKDTDGDGYRDKDGKMLELLLVSGDGSESEITGQSLQNQFKEVGIKLNLESYAGGYQYDVVARGEYDLGLLRFGWMEPCTLFQYAFTDDPNELTVPGIEEEYYAKVAECQHEPDADKRTALIGELEHLIADNMISIPVFGALDTLVLSDNFDNLLVMPGGFMYFNDMGPAK